MSDHTLQLTPQVYDYLLSHSVKESPAAKALRLETHQKTNMAVMQISPEQGQFMRVLMELLQAKKTLDIGTFTGYSALCIAQALPADGRVMTCDVSEEWTAMAKRFWEEAGVANKIELRLAPALETLQALIDAGEAGTFDFVFIDADKANYSAYYEKSLILLRQGGLIAIDNVLWEGAVANKEDKHASTVAIREVNDKVYADKRVSMCMLPIGDGLTLARKL